MNGGRVDSDVQFSPGFEEWIARAEFSADPADDGVVVASDGGEIRHYVRRGAEGYVVTHADRASSERFAFEAAAFDDLERYLVGEIGFDVRAYAGLGILMIPVREDQTAPGFALVLFADGSSGLRRSNGEVLAVRFSLPASAVTFSWYADAALDEIERSFSDPTGKPLFARFTER